MGTSLKQEQKYNRAVIICFALLLLLSVLLLPFTVRPQGTLGSRRPVKTHEEVTFGSWQASLRPQSVSEALSVSIVTTSVYYRVLAMYA